MSYLSNELDDLDKDVKWSVPGHHSLGTLGEQTVDDALQARLGRRVALTLDTDHVNPQQTVQGLCTLYDGTRKSSISKVIYDTLNIFLNRPTYNVIKQFVSCYNSYHVIENVYMLK